MMKAPILMVDDDEDDRMLTERAFSRVGLKCPLEFVEDGEELLDYLLRRGRYADRAAVPLPSIILLDLNMPRCDGREALAALKQHPELRRIPVIVLTTSQRPTDVLVSYELGASTYIVKPFSLDGLINMARNLLLYWFELAAIPSEAT